MRCIKAILRHCWQEKEETMHVFSDHEKLWNTPKQARLWGLTLVLLMALGLNLTNRTSVHAADQPAKGGTILWAVHEGMPDFDIHYQGTYIAAQPVGPIYNGLLTFDVYDNEKIVGDLAERWEITE